MMIWDTDNAILNKAKEKAIAFCIEHGFSVEKLKTQSFYILGDIAFFAQKMEYKGTGLKEDLISQPKATLEYDILTDTVRPDKYVFYLSD